MYKNIIIEQDGSEAGSLQAHLNISKNDEVVLNYFNVNHKMELDKIYELLEKSNTQEISIIMNIYVDEDYRWIGLGSDLLENFFTLNKSSVYLICDLAENDFVLGWYQRNGFEIIDYIYGCPIMLKKV